MVIKTLDIRISDGQRVLLVAALREFVPFSGIDPSAIEEVALLLGMFIDAESDQVLNNFAPIMEGPFPSAS